MAPGNGYPVSTWGSQDRFRRLFWIGIGVSLVFHVLALSMATQVVRITKMLLKEEERVSTRFVMQRDPRVAKPFEMRKRPQSRERKMVRQEVDVQTRTSQLVSSRVGGLSMRSLSPAPMNLDVGSKLVSIDMGARTVDLGVTATKEPDKRIDMREQLLDLNFMDTGKYQAMVVQDPNNKQKIQGYFHIAQAYSARMVERNIESNVIGGDSGTEMLQNPHAVQNVVDALNEYTSIHADFSARLPLSSRELLDTPWVFVPPMAFTLTEGELENLGRYLKSGGFLLLDASTSVGSEYDAFFRQMVKDALATVGKEARFTRLPNDHPIYHAFFDFDGPPGSGTGVIGVRIDYLVGVEVDNRLAVVISYQGLAANWENVGFRNDRKYYSDNARYLQFGINTIVFALTQQGSITNRVMQTVK